MIFSCVHHRGTHKKRTWLPPGIRRRVRFGTTKDANDNNDKNNNNTMSQYDSSPSCLDWGQQQQSLPHRRIPSRLRQRQSSSSRKKGDDGDSANAVQTILTWGNGTYDGTAFDGDDAFTRIAHPATGLDALMACWVNGMFGHGGGSDTDYEDNDDDDTLKDGDSAISAFFRSDETRTELPAA